MLTLCYLLFLCNVNWLWMILHTSLELHCSSVAQARLAKAQTNAFKWNFVCFSFDNCEELHWFRSLKMQFLKKTISVSLCYFHWQFCASQVITQRIIGSPRKRGQEDLHLQSCGALSSSPSPSMRRPKHLPQTTSASTNPPDSPSSEQGLECRETILWPLS